MGSACYVIAAAQDRCATTACMSSPSYRLTRQNAILASRRHRGQREIASSQVSASNTYNNRNKRLNGSAPHFVMRMYFFVSTFAEIPADFCPGHRAENYTVVIRGDRRELPRNNVKLDDPAHYRSSGSTTNRCDLSHRTKMSELV
jgi:hypothetical protein